MTYDPNLKKQIPNMAAEEAKRAATREVSDREIHDYLTRQIAGFRDVPRTPGSKPQFNMDLAIESAIARKKERSAELEKLV